MPETEYVITKDGIVSRVDATEYIRVISSKEELTDLIERMPYITTINAPNGKARRDLYDITDWADAVSWKTGDVNSNFSEDQPSVRGGMIPLPGVFFCFQNAKIYR